MNYPERFNEIRCYSDAEASFVISQIFARPEIKKILAYVLGEDYAEYFLRTLPEMKTIDDFQRIVIIPVLMAIEHKTCTSVTLNGSEKINKEKGALYLTNHRDIVLDSAFLNIHLYLKGFNTSQIGIGNNLLIQPWIEHAVRLNKSFIVRRNGSIKEQLLISKNLSEYIRYVITERKDAVWLAQREGRAKDSNDVTQSSIIKMLNMSSKLSFVESVNELNITPIAINYEFDACDFLKAKEFQLKRDNPQYKKSPMDDLLSMQTGLIAPKGRVSYNVCDPIVAPEEWNELTKNEQVSLLTAEIDKRIHANYILYPNNYVAADLLTNSNKFSDKYTQKDEEKFIGYVDKQLNKVDIPNPDFPFLRHMIYTMYANPVLNQEIALKK
ncbi:MAG: 1-acyl-sn-glycerol-3-phosphate acyltransferase [Paludibacteraceae bacterium]|nr:1-acyl-sn-glycerol-3-phosphate acyltransferase [Paludibacteraceae bacterium]